MSFYFFSKFTLRSKAVEQLIVLIVLMHAINYFNYKLAC